MSALSPQQRAQIERLLSRTQIRLSEEVRETMRHFATAACTELETALDAWLATAMPQLEAMTPPADEETTDEAP